MVRPGDSLQLLNIFLVTHVCIARVYEFKDYHLSTVCVSRIYGLVHCIVMKWHSDPQDKVAARNSFCT